jgi:hypothetical protein
MTIVASWIAVIGVVLIIVLVDWERVFGVHQSAPALDERVIFEIRPLFPFRAVIVSVVLFVALLVMLGGTLRGMLSPKSMSLTLMLSSFLILIVFIVSFSTSLTQLVYWMALRYRLTNLRVAIISRYFGIERSIPLHNIQSIELRGKSVGTIIVHSAAYGGTVVMFSVNNPRKYHDLIIRAIHPN